MISQSVSPSPTHPLLHRAQLTTVKVVKAHLDVKYEKIPPNCFNFPIPCATLIINDELSSSAALLHASVNVAAVLCTNAALVFVMVELAVVAWAVASAMTLPPLKILPAMLSMNSGALCARRGKASRRSIAEGSRDELFVVSMLLLCSGRVLDADWGGQASGLLSWAYQSEGVCTRGCVYRSLWGGGMRFDDMALLVQHCRMWVGWVEVVDGGGFGVAVTFTHVWPCLCLQV